MKEEEFLNGIEGALNDFEMGILTKSETKNYLLEHFLKVVDPLSKSVEHLQLFIYRVSKMRNLQKEYFSGNRKVFNQAKQTEISVDRALEILEKTFGYKIIETGNKVQQTKLL